MSVSCLICGQDVSDDYKYYADNYKPNSNTFICRRCGLVHLTHAAASDFPAMGYSTEDKNALSITLRNEWERSGRNPSANKRQRTLEDLNKMISQFRPLEPLAMLDNAMLLLGKATKGLGHIVTISNKHDYPFYFCTREEELNGLLKMLVDESYVEETLMGKYLTELILTVKGYSRLRELQQANQEFNQCFVAMWFAGEMKEAFEEAIAPAIEYVEPGEENPRFKAVKIDNVEHVNDINDEIIAQIRRSRFMVCDLTGYRGGVYFEAGFAYGLGLDVIYTCRKDWTREEILKDAPDGNEVKALYDKKGNKIPVKKEGVHFDLAHRNRITWEPDKLDDFKIALENRIKAVIY